ncbi:MAG: potassium-transporting ATPase subunit KdpA [Gemmatimonadaceae bacterium]|nr:potassium-transporting ATPase subunit KdpA [Gemmatimonadaceae bacterium]
MTRSAWLQSALFIALVLLAAHPLGVYMARVYQGQRTILSPLLAPLERLCLRLTGVSADSETGWAAYARQVLLFSAAGVLLVYALQRLQGLLPLNPLALGAVEPTLALNTAISFVTNTNWQAYGGEGTMSYLTQMLALGTQNFVSAAAGMAVLAALVRAFTRAERGTIGDFRVDLVRGTVHVLLPLSLVLAVALAGEGVVQTFDAPATAHVLDAAPDPTATQVIPLGPAASQVAIKQLGTNGGGFFSVNSAHPLENPTPLSNLLQLVAILLIPAALCCTFGAIVGDMRQGWAILAAMTMIFTPLAVGTIAAEQAGTPLLARAGVMADATATQAGGNMEGKEVRFGIVNSALWATATTAASNGSVNAMHDSFTPLGGLAPTWLMQLGEIVYGGAGSGLYGMLVFALITVFIAGLMVGRTPEYLGKKIEAFEMKMSALVILLPSAAVLLGTALAVGTQAGRSGILNPGAHGFTEVLYALSSASNNNGSAFGGLSVNTPFYNVLLAVVMWVGRFGVIIPVLAIAGSLAQKKRVPAGAGTLPTHTPLFTALLIGTVLLVGALTFLPALALGPVVEQLQQGGR